MEIIEKKSLNCESIVLGFKQCLGGCLYKYFGEFQMYKGVHFGETNPKLVKWVSFRNFGFKVNFGEKNQIRVNKCIA